MTKNEILAELDKVSEFRGNHQAIFFLIELVREIAEYFPVEKDLFDQ